MTIDEMVEQLANGVNSPAYELLDCFDKNDFQKATKVIKRYLKCDDNTAKICCMDFKTKVYDELNKPDPSLSAWEIQQANCVPTCPICGSTNLTKLSNVGKAAKVGFFGIFGAGDLGKTWKCKNCGSKF